jgi:glycosyltransferase involved in cell wall biosynthesis
MQVGVPVLTSNTSSLPEVAGPGGLLVNPASVTSIYQAIEKLANRPNLRKSLSQKALKHAQQFSWAKTATQTLAVYEKINS